MNAAQVDIPTLTYELQRIRSSDELERFFDAKFPAYTREQLMELMIKAMWYGGHTGFPIAYAKHLKSFPSSGITAWIAAQPPRPWDIDPNWSEDSELNPQLCDEYAKDGVVA